MFMKHCANENHRLTDAQTNRKPENIMLPPPGCRGEKKKKKKKLVLHAYIIILIYHILHINICNVLNVIGMTLESERLGINTAI